MTVKTKAVELLGEAELMLPAQLAEALGGNDRAKVLFSVLQAARAHAENPHGHIPQFEHQATGLGDLDIEEIIDQSRAVVPGTYVVPDFDRLRDRLLAAIAAMLAPLEGQAPGDRQTSGEGQTPGEFRRRYDTLAEALRRIDGQAIAATAIDQIASADLARLTTFAAEPEARRYLEALVARAYAEVHGAEASVRHTRMPDSESSTMQIISVRKRSSGVRQFSSATRLLAAVFACRSAMCACFGIQSGPG